MAMRAANQVVEGENGVLPNAMAGKAAAGAKAGVGLQAQNKRRALGDLSNQQPAAAAGKPALAKEKATAPAPAVEAGVKTRAAARRADGAVVKDAPMPTGATLRPAQLVPRTRAQAAQAQRVQGPSMSSLLSQRSEAFVGSQSVRAPPPSPLPDIDSNDKLNPLMAADYVNDIYYFYKRVEPKYKVPADYMTKQTDINDKMRAILIDWLVEVHLKFKLMPETLFLTVNLIDRFLTEKQVTRKNLQLVRVQARPACPSRHQPQPPISHVGDQPPQSQAMLRYDRSRRTLPLACIACHAPPQRRSPAREALQCTPSTRLPAGDCACMKS
ncbi:hypothetical protein PLESTB_000857700 [Pleodorina starrii]|uniref:Cyclin N-terminal domain-containing protein n=1 Tax=Pleodorina starrii TaxID=330485 RepID=A0A9W6BN32_9CHLO|nr:hypothetical protein PLESTB_000857700 [Pleodorina starrii]